jgi:hypothetical protein
MHKGLVFVGMGFELLGVILGCLFVGQEVDKQMGWPGYGLIVFVVGGLVGWMIHLIFMLKKFMANEPETHD